MLAIEKYIGPTNFPSTNQAQQRIRYTNNETHWTLFSDEFTQIPISFGKKGLCEQTKITDKHLNIDKCQILGVVNK